MQKSSENTIFANKNLGNENRTETGLDNGRTVERSAKSGLVERSERGSGIHRTIETSNDAGNDRTVRTVEEREELEARGINPDWSRPKFLRELRKNADKNGILLDRSYLDDKTLIHDRKSHGTSENDVYENSDGKTLTKLNILPYVISGEHSRNLNALIDRFNSHNELFPNVAYSIKGFMDNSDGNITMVLEQSKIEAERNATQAEIDKYFIDNGFKLSGVRDWSNGHKVWSNGKYEIFDARPANVLKGKDGKLYFIDVVPHSVEYLKNAETSPDIRFQIIPEMPKAADYPGKDVEFADAIKEYKAYKTNALEETSGVKNRADYRERYFRLKERLKEEKTQIADAVQMVSDFAKKALRNIDPTRFDVTQMIIARAIAAYIHIEHDPPSLITERKRKSQKTVSDYL